MSYSSTVDSSEAVADINQQYIDLKRKIADEAKASEISVPTNVGTNLNFDESEGIHYGDVIYHIHHHSPKSGTDDRPSPRISSSSSKIEIIKLKKRWFEKFQFLKRPWIILTIISIVIIAVSISLIVYFTLKNSNNNENDTNDNETTTEFITTTTLNDFESLIITRELWGASEINSSKILKLQIPIERIIIAHTRGQFCSNENFCISTVQSLQTQDQSLDDIPYNFLIGGDGRIYEGRGIEYQGQHTDNLDATEYNSIGICIAFIGSYESKNLTSTQISLLTKFIDFYKEKGLIADDHIIVLQDDLKYFITKATSLNAEIEKLDNFRSLYKIYRREEWNAQRRLGEPSKLDLPINWVLIGHTDTPLCTSLEACKNMARTLQKNCFEKNPPWADIYYNIFFGGDGYAFEGRGFDNWGAHASGFNDITIGIGVIGNFESVAPNQAILDAILQVLEDAKDLGKLTEDYKIFGRKDFRGPGPGTAFMDIIKGWCRYGNRTISC